MSHVPYVGISHSSLRGEAFSLIRLGGVHVAALGM